MLGERAMPRSSAASVRRQTILARLFGSTNTRIVNDRVDILIGNANPYYKTFIVLLSTLFAEKYY